MYCQCGETEKKLELVLLITQFQYEPASCQLTICMVTFVMRLRECTKFVASNLAEIWTRHLPNTKACLCSGKEMNNSVKSSWAINHVKWSEETNILGTISVPIIRDLVWTDLLNILRVCAYTCSELVFVAEPSSGC
jgi:hypothetical protein